MLHCVQKYNFFQGHYIQINGTFDPNLLQFVPLEGYYWKYKTKYYDYESKKLLFTHCVELAVVSVQN